MRPYSKKELNQVMLTILSGDKQAIESMRVTDPLYKNSVNIIERFREQYEITTYKICADPRPSRKHEVRSKAVLFVVYDDKIIIPEILESPDNALEAILITLGNLKKKPQIDRIVFYCNYDTDAITTVIWQGNYFLCQTHTQLFRVRATGLFEYGKVFTKGDETFLVSSHGVRNLQKPDQLQDTLTIQDLIDSGVVEI
jgi:hypothetical protein